MLALNIAKLEFLRFLQKIFIFFKNHEKSTYSDIRKDAILFFYIFYHNNRI